MDDNLWIKCEGPSHITSLSETVWRVVEAQGRTSTRKLVDSLREQAILEDLIEETKLPLTKNITDLHWLLYTPFRYPPLKHGSRFSSRYEYSLWYGSLHINTALAEKAFYQFNFLRASKADYGIIEIPLTAFSILVKTKRGVYLTKPPFMQYADIISSPLSYQASQELGSAMRHAQVEAFTYLSARHKSSAINMALFSSKAFACKAPNNQSFQSWQCIASNNLIEFIRTSALTQESLSFSLDTFLIDKNLPFPPG